MKRLGDEQRAVVRRVLAVVAAMAVGGALVGAGWAFLAPPVHAVIALNKAGDRLFAYLGNDSERLFTSAMIMIGLLGGAGVVAGVLAWQWRRQRGPQMITALTLGGLVAAAAATGVGAAVARLRYGVVDIATAPVSPENRIHYVMQAPPVFFGHTPLLIFTTLVVPAAAAAAIYGFMTAASAYDDLGAGVESDSAKAAPSVPESVG